MRRRALSTGLGGALVALALAPGVAHASALNMSGTQLRYDAGNNETNKVTIDLQGTNYVVTDAAGITITPTAPCTAVGNQGSCPAAGVSVLQVTLGNLNDTATIGASVTEVGDPSQGDPGAQIEGQAGNDVLNGGPAIGNNLFGASQFTDESGDDTLVGGSLRDNLIAGSGTDQILAGGGGDSLNGGPGNDTMRGEDGDDSFRAGSSPDGGDILDGADGQDFADYTDRTGDLSLDSGDGADDGEGCPGPTCEGDELISMTSIGAGSGNDTVTGDETRNFLSGNEGTDTVSGGDGLDGLNGGTGDDQLDGGGGADELTGGDGSDIVAGGDGDDILHDSGIFALKAPIPDADTYSGGAGLDLIDYGGEVEPLAVSADSVGGDGADCPGLECENDNVLTDVEDIDGGTKADTLIGNAAANEITGANGNDVIVGAGGSDGLSGGDGDDTLDGGPDPDTLDGAAGVDLIRSRDGGPDQLDCGSSLDTVIGESFDLAPASCENVSDGVVIGSAKAKGKKVKLTLSCPPAEGGPCPVKAKLSFKGDKIATGKGTIPAAQTKKLKLKLTDAGSELLAGHDKPKVDAKVTYTDATGAVVVSSQKVVLG